MGLEKGRERAHPWGRMGLEKGRAWALPGGRMGLASEEKLRSSANPKGWWEFL